MSEAQGDRRLQLLELIKAENPTSIGWLISDLHQHLADVHGQRLMKLLAEGPIAALYVSAGWIYEEDGGENYLPLTLEIGLEGGLEMFGDDTDEDAIDRIGEPDHWAPGLGRGFPDYNSEDEQPHKSALFEAMNALHSHLYYQGQATVRTDSAVLATRDGISYAFHPEDIAGHLRAGAIATQIIAIMGAQRSGQTMPPIDLDDFVQMLAVDPVAAKKIVLEGPIQLTPELQDAIAAHDARDASTKSKRLTGRMR